VTISPVTTNLIASGAGLAFVPIEPQPPMDWYLLSESDSGRFMWWNNAAGVKFHSVVCPFRLGDLLAGRRIIAVSAVLMSAVSEEDLRLAVPISTDRTYLPSIWRTEYPSLPFETAWAWKIELEAK